jgi:hypothetical protein
MKLSKVLSVMGLIAVLTACGSSQPTNQTNGVVSPLYGYNNGYNSGYNPYANQNGYNYGYGSPVFGMSQTVYGNTVQLSAPVNAGERINVNLSAATYRAGVAYCDGKVFDTSFSGGRERQLNNVTLTLNGQPITGTTQVTAAGTLVLTAYIEPGSINCGWAYRYRPANVSSYIVNVGYAVTR